MPEAIDEDGNIDYGVISRSGRWYSNRMGQLDTDRGRLEYNSDSIEGGVKYSQYTLPGGKNYKELLLTMPRKRYRAGETKEPYQSPHFDEPNILAHIRFDERMANGERILFLEEIQSDWAQQGKRQGRIKMY